MLRTFSQRYLVLVVGYLFNRNSAVWPRFVNVFGDKNAITVIDVHHGRNVILKVYGVLKTKGSDCSAKEKPMLNEALVLPQPAQALQYRQGPKTPGAILRHPAGSYPKSDV